MSGSPGTGGSNPRKFSEKIALHNQKQAEETRAFEQLMTDLNVSRVNTLRSGVSYWWTLLMTWNGGGGGLCDVTEARLIFMDLSGSLVAFLGGKKTTKIPKAKWSKARENQHPGRIQAWKPPMDLFYLIAGNGKCVWSLVACKY